MKKLIIALLVAVALMLTGCGESSPYGGERQFGITYFRDAETGVYYVRSYGYGVCPRYNADGTLYTGGEE